MAPQTAYQFFGINGSRVKSEKREKPYEKEKNRYKRFFSKGEHIGICISCGDDGNRENDEEMLDCPTCCQSVHKDAGCNQCHLSPIAISETKFGSNRTNKSWRLEQQYRI